MSTYTFKTVGTRISVEGNGSYASEPRNNISIRYDGTNRVYVETAALDSIIDVTKDTVVIDSTTYAPNSQSGRTIYEALLALFPDANTGSGGSGGTSDYNALSNKPFTDAEVVKLKALLNIDNTAQ